MREGAMTEKEFLALGPREQDAAVAIARGEEEPIWTLMKGEWVGTIFNVLSRDECSPNEDHGLLGWLKEGGLGVSVVPFFVTDIATAWELVKEMRGEGWMFCLDDLGFDGEMWRVRFDKDRDVSDEWHIGEHDDEKVAISIAYMKAKGAIT